MKRTLTVVAAGVVVVLAALPGCGPAGPNLPFPHHTTLSSGTLRVTNRTQAVQDGDVRRAYDDWKDNYLVAAGSADGNPLYRVAMGGPLHARHHETTSESQGYGMIITAYLAGHDKASRAVFDGLWRFSRQHTSEIDPRLMGYLVPEQGDTDNSAFDGDADIAYGLMLADAQWGSDGPIDYAAEAQTVLDGVLESTIGPQSRLPELGDWVATNGSRYNQWTPRTSDLMPAHFKAFARFTGDSTWSTVVTRSKQAVTGLQADYAATTGLLPDFTVRKNATGAALEPAPAGFLEGPHDGAYYYNALRDPWRIGTDAAISGDATSRAQVRKVSEWLRAATGGTPANVEGGYKLDGTLIGDYFSIGFAAPFAVAAMQGPSGTAPQKWLNDLYSSVRNTREEYYEDSVALLSMLVVTGNYWDPTIEEA